MDKPKVKLPFGTGCYETIAVVNQRPAFLERHLERLARGADWLNIPRARERVLQMIRNKLAACPAEPTAFRAEAQPHGIPSSMMWPRFRDITNPTGLYYPKPGKARGPEDTIKHNQRAAKTTARNEAKAAGAWDSLVVDATGSIAESTIANIFAVIDGKLVTPGDAQMPLPGVARGIVLEEVARLGLPIEFRGLTFDDLSRASEVFLTNSLIGVLPVQFVVAFDGRRIDLQPTHPTTDQLAAARQAREDKDLKTAPGPAEIQGI